MSDSKKTPKKKEKVEKYLAEAKVLGRLYTAEGETAYEAVENLKPPVVKGHVILTVKHGKESKERVISSIHASRVFNTQGSVRDMMLKNISLMFENV